MMDKSSSRRSERNATTRNSRGEGTSRARLLRDLLVEWFAANQLSPGDRIPSEDEIATLGQVGRSTAREALKLLEQEGVVIVRPGKGRYLTSLGSLNVERPITKFESQSDMLAALGYSFSTVTLSVYEGTPDATERDELKLSDDDTVIRVERLRLTGDEPLIYSVCTIRRECFAGPIKHINWTRSLNALLAAQGYAPASSSARIRAVRLPSDVASMYNLDPIEPWLLINETVVTDTGVRIVYASDYHRGRYFAFNVLRTP